MLETFKNHINNNLSFLNQKKLFVAVSAGMDSMVLLTLLQSVNFEIAVLHCNFNLRDNESNADAEFIKKYCQNYKIDFFENSFDTKSFAKQHKLSTQLAARKLRYDWFTEMLFVHHFDYVLTAHHLDDCLETFIINLSRGTGLDGLLSIPVLNNKVVRPLLPFSREQISKFAQDNKISWREDSSNGSDKYLRNKIRHHVVPQLKLLNNNFLNNFTQTQHFLGEKNALVQDAVELVYKDVVSKIDSSFYINIEFLLKHEHYKKYLYEWLKVYNFKAWNDIYELVGAENGKKVLSLSHQIIKNKIFLIVSELHFEQNLVEYKINDESDLVKIPINLSFCKVSDISTVGLNTIFVDENKIVYPLKLRKPKTTDFFFPKGMIGSKKIMKFIKDLKLHSQELNKIWLLLNASDEIIWVVNHRQDRRFLVNDKTKNILKLDFKQ